MVHLHLIDIDYGPLVKYFLFVSIVHMLHILSHLMCKYTGARLGDIGSCTFATLVLQLPGNQTFLRARKTIKPHI